MGLVYIITVDQTSNTKLSSNQSLDSINEDYNTQNNTSKLANKMNTMDDPSFIDTTIGAHRENGDTLVVSDTPTDVVVERYDEDGNAIAVSKAPTDVVVGTHDEDGNAIAQSKEPTDVIVGTHDKDGNAIAASNAPTDIVVGTHDEDGNAIAVSPMDTTNLENKEENVTLKVNKATQILN